MFRIRTSKNISYTSMPGGSFSGLDRQIYDLRQTEIFTITKRDDGSIFVSFYDQDKNEKNAYIRSKNEEGSQELKTIMASAQAFVGKSYDDFINHQFGL